MRTSRLLLIALPIALLIGAIGGYFAWTTTKTSPLEQANTTPTTNTTTTRNETPKTPTTASPSGTFSPPTGAGDHAGTEGPWARRILGARSIDGITWTKTEEIITDQGDVPSLVMDSDGTLFMYYYGWTVGTKQNVPAVAISEDDGESWTFSYLQFSGYPGRGDVSDPDVLYEDGLFRMYGTTRDGGTAHILHGEGTDGVHFTYKGVAFEPDGDAGVASVYKTEDGWSMYSLASLGMGGNAETGLHWYATSTDGKTFTEKDTVFFRVDGVPYFNGNVVAIETGYRLYLFTDDAGGIRSWTSTDSEQWSIENGARLTLDTTNGKEKGYVGDPDVVQLPDGSYFMAYATLIP